MGTKSSTTRLADPSSSDIAKTKSFSEDVLQKTKKQLGYDIRDKGSRNNFAQNLNISIAGNNEIQQARAEQKKLRNLSNNPFYNKFLNVATDFAQQEKAGEQLKVRDRKRTIFAGANQRENIFRKTLGGL